MPYRASLTISCAKQHVCVHCGGKFSYLFQRKVEAEGHSREAAAAAADQLANHTIQATVELHECPYCGTVQPEMVAEVQSHRYWLGLLLGVGVLSLCLILGALSIVRIDTAAWIALTGALLVVGMNAWGLFCHPNRSLRRNRTRAQHKVAAARLSPDDPPNQNPETQRPHPAGRQPAAEAVLGFCLTVVALVVTLAPIALREINGWVANSSTYPAVVGPGDTARVYFDQKITSLQGMWEGTTHVKVTNPAEIGQAAGQIQATTKASNWGQTISGRSLSTNHMWVDLKIPEYSSLAGKSIQADLQVRARYPFVVETQFDVKSEVFTHSTQLRLSSVGAGTAYNHAWWVGQWAALGLLVTGGILLLGSTKTLSNSGSSARAVPL